MKVLLISHIADLDGIMPVILSKLIFSEFEFILAEIDEVDDIVKDVIEGGIDRYDHIYITDLCVSPSIAHFIDKEENLKARFTVLDHHHSRIGMNAYSFITVLDVDDHLQKQSGTSLYYQYLNNKFNHDTLKKDVVKKMVELTRQLDTWDFKDEDCKEAMGLGRLLSIYGRDYFIDYYYRYILENDYFLFDERQKYLLEVEEIRIKNYAERKKGEIIDAFIKNYHVGIVFAESSISMVGNMLAEEYRDVYDFIILINISRGISYRGCKNIDLGDFAKIYGGGGHLNASGSPIPCKLKEMILSFIYDKDIEFK